MVQVEELVVKASLKAALQFVCQLESGVHPSTTTKED
jgi:hypothetical protein